MSMLEDAIKLTLSLYNNHRIPRQAVDDIVKQIDSFISESYVPHLRKKLAAELDDVSDNNIIDRVNLVMEENKNPLKPLSTEHLRFKHYEKSCGFVHPESYEIGTETIFEIVSTLVIRVKHVKRYGVFMPIGNTLKNFLELPGLFHVVMDYVQSLENENFVVSNILQGRLWKTKYKLNQNTNNKIILPVFLYYDDFETGNTLGSHGGQQELGGLYLGLPFLPPHLVAKLTNIFAVAVFYTKHRKSIGSKGVCQKVIDEINKLCTDGIALNIDKKIVTVYFRCLLILGDNLGLNCICGFVESFSATRYCRICRATSVQCKIMTVEDETLLRTVQNYKQDVQKSSITTGIKTECVFNQLIDFHIIENRTLDIMHDLFEGIVRYTLSKVLTCLIFNDKLLSIDILNRRISEFYFGEVELNKPQPICKESGKVNENDIVKNKIKLKQSSAEMLCLCRYLGVLIGDLIPGNNVYWKLYLVLREIIGIVTAPMFNIADISQIRYLIHQHNEAYLQLFGKLKPKMHFLIHIPEVMLDNGPVIHFWSMPYERKNRILKEIAVSTRSHRNVPLTIGFRNQLQQCYSQIMCDNVKNDIILGTIEDENDTDIANYIPTIKTANSHKFVKICGKKYICGSIIVIEINDKEVEFGKILKIYNISKHVYFLVSEVVNLLFDYHYYAYKVNVYNEPHAFYNTKMLPKVGPCLLTKIQSDYYVTTRYNV